MTSISGIGTVECVKNDQQRRRFQCHEVMAGEPPVEDREQEGVSGGASVVARWLAVGLDLAGSASVLIVVTG